MSHDELTNLNPLEKAVEKALAEKVNHAQPLQRAPESNLDVLRPPSREPSEKQAVLTEVGAISNPAVQLDLDTLAQRQIVGHLKNGIGTNVFNLLRSQVMAKMQRNNCRTLAITGPTEGVGKSLTAMNLALAIAKQKRLEVSLLDFDLRKPSIAHLLDLKRETGVVDYLQGDRQLGEIATKTQFENISMYLGNTSQQNAAELLSNEYAHNILPLLAPTDKHFVVVDLPPILGLSDVHTFLPMCDAVLLVVEYARTTKEEMEESIRLLGNKPLVGTVVNRGHLSSLDVYGYGYNSEQS